MAAAASLGEGRTDDVRSHGLARVARVAPAASVENRCVGLTRSAGPLRCALAALAGRLQAGRGWEQLGYARAGDYTRERLGLSARELADLARVDTALRTLPRVEAALVSGELPWTKVRLLARAARPEEEAKWIAFARRVSVRQLEHHVRAIDTGSVEAGGAEPDPDDAGRRQGIVLRLRPDIQAKWQLGWRVTRRVAGEALDPGACAEWILAEVLSGLPAAPDGEGDAEAAVAPHGLTFLERRPARWGQREAAPRTAQTLQALFAKAARERSEEEALEGGTDRETEPVALPPFLRDLVAGLEEADPFALDTRLRRAVALEQRLEAELGPLLRRVATGRLYRLRGYPGLAAYAEDRLGISARKCWALLRIERAAGACPALLRAYRDGRLSWVQAQALLPILGRAPAFEEAWIALARRVTVRRLRDDVDRALLQAETDPEALARTGGVPDLEAERDGKARLQTGANATSSGEAYLSGESAPRETARAFFTAPRDVARLFWATLCTVRRRLGRQLGRPATRSDALDAMLEHCFEAWGVRDPEQERERKKRYRIFERDGWRCAVPGCTSYRNLHAHHVTPRSQGGGDADENLITLCAWHHQRAVHTERVVRIGGRLPDRARFELGVRPDGPPLAVYRSGDVLVGRLCSSTPSAHS